MNSNIPFIEDIYKELDINVLSILSCITSNPRPHFLIPTNKYCYIYGDTFFSHSFTVPLDSTHITSNPMLTSFPIVWKKINNLIYIWNENGFWEEISNEIYNNYIEKTSSLFTSKV